MFLVYILGLQLNHNKSASLGGGGIVVASLRAEINSQCLLVHISPIYNELETICQPIKKGDFLSKRYNNFMNTNRLLRQSISFLFILCLAACNLPQPIGEGFYVSPIK